MGLRGTVLQAEAVTCSTGTGARVRVDTCPRKVVQGLLFHGRRQRVKLSHCSGVILKSPLKPLVQTPLCKLTHGLGDKIALILERAMPTGCFSQAALAASFPCQQALQL